MALEILKQHNLDPRQVFHTAMTMHGTKTQKLTSTIETRRKKLQKKLNVLYIKACTDLGISELEPTGMTE